MDRYALSKPIKYDGKEITEITLNLDDLSVTDLETAEKRFRAKAKKKEVSLIIEFSKKYQVEVASIASGHDVELFRMLGARDYTGICMEVQSFLLAGELEETDENEEEQTQAHGKTPTQHQTPPRQQAT